MDENLRNFRMMEEVEVVHIGQVGAGSTVELFEFARTMKIPKPKWAKTLKHVATAEVCGDSLKGEGIFNGDILVCKVIFDKREVREGRLVVVKLPTGRSVVKRIHFFQNKVALRSSNVKYKDMYFDRDDIEVEGIVKELVRKLD